MRGVVRWVLSPVDRWVRCRVDGQLHRFNPRVALQLAEGCAVAHCGALLVIQDVAGRAWGDTLFDVPGRRVRVMSGKHHTPPWWRRLGRRPPAEKPRRLLTEMVDGVGLAHWVSREAFEQGLREGTGCYVVLCGRRIAAASMVTPPERSCRSCQEAWAA